MGHTIRYYWTSGWNDVHRTTIRRQLLSLRSGIVRTTCHLLVISCLAFCAKANSSAQGFTEVYPGSLTAAMWGSVSWGDYDNDGDLDILQTGAQDLQASKIYQNTGVGFVEVFPGNLTGVGSSSAWGDYDNDGHLDIVLTGIAGSGTHLFSVSKIYHNTGNGFTEMFQGKLQAVTEGSVAWGDYNNDGYPDILLTGLMGAKPISRIYRNDRGNGFSEVFPGSLTGVYDGSVAWGDYDKDGDQDILLTGCLEGGIQAGCVSKLYENTGNGFVEVYPGGLTAVGWGSVAWGDYDNDGHLDIFLAGVSAFGPPSDYVSKIYRNTGHGFTEVFPGSLRGGCSGPGTSAAWGDYDNDGDLDLLITGTGKIGEINGRLSRVYQNAGNGFTEVFPGSLLAVQLSSVAWGDYDKDGDLDIVLQGNTDYSDCFAKIYRNDGTVFNTVPNTPTGLNTTVLGRTVTLSWDKANDVQTPQNGLTYSLFIGTTPGGIDRLSPMADVSTGYRRVVRMGNMNHVNSYTMKDLADGTYYWSVQAIDNAFAGSPFAVPGGTFTIAGATNTDDSGPGSLREAISLANTQAGADTIRFNFPGSGPHTIHLLSPLPVITEALFIDGYSQPGAQANTNPIGQGSNAILKIELNGTSAGADANGLEIACSGCKVRGLVISRFDGNGIQIMANGSSVLEGNCLGTDVTGTLDLGNGRSGIRIDSQSNTIGPFNVICFNGEDGVHVEGGSSTGNIADQNHLADNARDGIRVENVNDGSTALTNSVIKRNLTGIHILDGTGVPMIAGNVIEDNSEAGILIEQGGGLLRQNATGESENFENNVISLNGNGIHLRPLSLVMKSHQQSTLHLFHNNIHANTDYGLLSENPLITVVADANWWGDASGPYNEGSNPDGQGDAIGGNVQFSTWLHDVLVLAISSVADAGGIPGNDVEMWYKVHNMNLDPQTCNMTVTDSLGWTLSPADFTLILEANSDTVVAITVTIPEQAVTGTMNKVILSGVSVQDPSVYGSDEAYAEVMKGLRGDINQDRAINILDVLRAVNIVLGVGNMPSDYETWAADCNADGTINILDALSIVNVLLGITPECLAGSATVSIYPETMEFLELLKPYLSPENFNRFMALVKSVGVPTEFELGQNYPNPFNPSTSIQFAVGSGQSPQRTTLKVYNILGQEVRTLLDEIKEPGFYTVTWDGKDSDDRQAASGIYFYRFDSTGFTATKRMVLMK